MVIHACAFTEEGREKLNELIAKSPEHIWVLRDKEDLQTWTGAAFSERLPILFVGACGIAVRAIAPYVTDKLTDSPVIVMDEKACHVIPILSGHMGGANELALEFAKKLDATPVITTATDVQRMFAIDVFAKKHGLRIHDRSMIQEISSKLLMGQEVTIPIGPNGLEPKRYCVGVGCKKGKTFEELNSFALLILEGLFQEPSKADDIYGFASIDLKKEETGILTMAQYYHTNFTTFSAEELMDCEGPFTGSSFVEAVTGVDNVCERSAMALAGPGAKLVVKKTSCDGMTIAVAERSQEEMYKFLESEDLKPYKNLVHFVREDSLNLPDQEKND